MIEKDERPECWNSTCEAPRGETQITSCIHCGGELHQVGNLWYHWSSFEQGQLLDGAQSQDYVKKEK